MRGALCATKQSKHCGELRIDCFALRIVLAMTDSVSSFEQVDVRAIPVTMSEPDVFCWAWTQSQSLQELPHGRGIPTRVVLVDNVSAIQYHHAGIEPPGRHFIDVRLSR